MCRDFANNKIYLRAMGSSTDAGEGENSHQALGIGQGKSDQLTPSIALMLSSLQSATNYHYARACISWAVGPATCASCGRPRYYVVPEVRALSMSTLEEFKKYTCQYRLHHADRDSCSRPSLEDDYFHLSSDSIAGADPPPPPNPRPRPPPPLPQPQRPPPGTQPASDALWHRAGAKGCTLGWGSK
jgi:hypothetical protein